MRESINSKDIKDFLQDYRAYSETSILEEGKEKDEIIEIAKAKGINLKDSRDLSGFKTIYTFANKANKNKARLPKDALLKALPTMIGKPVDIDHDRKYVIGHYIDYRYKQKEDMVVAYGVFYKGNFGKEWEKAKELFKAKKLATSYEIWCPTDKRKQREDGTFDLLEQEIAGGALLFNEEPAFEDAKVLELAKTNLEQQSEELVFAYKQDELIVSEVTAVETPVVTSPTIKCANCKEDIDLMKVPEYKQGSIKCPHCFAILNGQTGDMIYPPQIINFKMLCPSCKMNSWLILAQKEDATDIKCNHCAKEYNVAFSKTVANDSMKGLEFFYCSGVSCLQCGTKITVFGISSIKTKSVKCHKCGLEFSYDIAYEQYININYITLKADESLAKDKEILNSSAEGGHTDMEYKIEISKFHRYSEDLQIIEDSLIDVDEIEEAKTEEAKKLQYEQRKGLSDDKFAVVIRVKNKVTGEMRKIRKFPINDEAHVRNALARLAQEAPKKTLEKLGVNIEDVKKKIMKKAKELNMTDLLERQNATVENKEVVVEKPTVEVSKIETPIEKSVETTITVETPVENKETITTTSEEIKVTPVVEKVEVAKVDKAEIRKAIKKIIAKAKNCRKNDKMKWDEEKAKLEAELKKASSEIEVAKVDNTSKVEFYKTNARLIVERRIQLGESCILTDEELVNDDKFALAKSELENAQLRAKVSSGSDKVGEVSEKGPEYYEAKRKEIDTLAFGKVNNKK